MQWHQLDHMQTICTSLQTDNHASTSPLSFFTGRMPFLLPNQQRQSTEGNIQEHTTLQITYQTHKIVGTIAKLRLYIYNQYQFSHLGTANQK